MDDKSWMVNKRCYYKNNSAFLLLNFNHLMAIIKICIQRLTSNYDHLPYNLVYIRKIYRIGY